MARVQVRFNKRHGQPGWGVKDEHVWRVFVDGKSHIVKHAVINVPSHTERDGQDWNICCEGSVVFDRETSTATVGEP